MAGRTALLVVTIANPSSVRVASFQEALARLGHPPSVVVPYCDLLEGRVTLEQIVQEGDVLRIDSPGQDFEVEKQLIARGAKVEDEEGPTRIGRDEALRLPFDRGRIWFSRQWFLGFRDLLRDLDRQRLACADHVAMNDPSEIEVMFDKPRCQSLLTSLGVSCPRSLGTIRSYEELRTRMRETSLMRVFVKLAHGSSASGVIAFAMGGRHLVATTTTEVIREGGEVRLYNSRTVRRISDEREIADLVDLLAREGVQVERWVPKAGIDGRSFDLRIVVIAGKTRHVVVRSSRGPLTNLHLKNRRDSPIALRALMPEGAWEAAMAQAERAAAAFPKSLHAGVDLVVAPGYRRTAVLEVNAFGDLLHGITDRAQSTQEAEIQALLEGWAA